MIKPLMDLLFCSLLLINLRIQPFPTRPIIKKISIEELEQISNRHFDIAPVGTVFPHERAKFPSKKWEFIGPMPILNEYWSNGMASGRVTAIFVHPYNPGIVYIGGAQGGIWKSVDSGQTWIPLTDELSSLATGAIALDPSNPDVVYYGTGEQHFCGDCFYGDGLFKSKDGGETWVKIAPTMYVGSYISKILIDPRDSLIIHITSNRGYVRSTDGGVTWYRKISIDWGTDLVMRSDSPSVLFAAIYSHGIYKSTDNGNSWVRLTGGLPEEGFRRINLAISESNPNIIYASFISDSGTLYGLYKTTDGGENWSLLPNTPNYPGRQGWYDNCIVVDPTDPDIVYAGGVFPYDTSYFGIVKSTDGGKTWRDITFGSDGSQLHPDQHALFIGPDGTLWVGNDGGIWKSTDGGETWINLNKTLGITQFYTVTLHPTDSNFILGGTQDNGSLRYEGNVAWPQQNAGDGGPSVIEWDSPNIYYTTYVLLSVIYKWVNGNYAGDVHGPWNGDRVSWCNAPFIADPNLPNTLLAGTHRVWKSLNSGESWSAISGDLTYGGHLRAIAVASGNSDIIYTGSSDGRVFLTKDGGSTWTEKTDAHFEGVTISDICLSPYDWKTLYLSLDRSSGMRVFMSSDSGENWEDITGNLPSGPRAMSMAVDFRESPPVLYLGTDYGVYVSQDNGENWVKTDGIPNVAVYDIAIDTVNNVVVSTTHGRGMWRLQTVTGVREYWAKTRPDLEISLYPNPVKNALFLSYMLPRGETFSLNIYNPVGQSILKSRVTGKGVKETIGLKISTLAQGVYFIRIDNGKESISERFLIIH